MNPIRSAYFLAVCLSFLAFGNLVAQTWNFVKQKDGIRIYISQETGKNLKSYKGETDMPYPAEKIFAVVEDANHTDWWDKNISEKRVISYVKNREARYYIVYKLPWPVLNRDLCVDAICTADPDKKIWCVVSRPLPDCVPTSKDYVRIRDYRQTWTITARGPNVSHVVLEGYFNPAGTIPDWVTNLVIGESPVAVMNSLRQKLQGR
jgi:hypothetical protein